MSTTFNHGPRLKVLVADDNRDAADSLAILMQMEHYDVEVCYDGASVIPAAEKVKPDACLLDVKMPGMDGWEVARRLRGMFGNRTLLLLAVTAWTPSWRRAFPGTPGSTATSLNPPTPTKYLVSWEISSEAGK
jgi:PleD family two-component response regulator